MTFSDFNTVVFDCDGVVLNSNKIKTQAFYESVIDFGSNNADDLVDYHKNNGGISRYRKFDYFLNNILPSSGTKPSLNELTERYASLVSEGLKSCQIEPSLASLRSEFPNSKWLIVSGGDQAEIRQIFSERGLEGFFDGGIFGSPDTKEDILSREIKIGNIKKPAVFIGDSKYDHLAASQYGLDFVFISQWTEFSDWNSYCENNDIPVSVSLSEVPKINFVLGS